MLKTFFGVANAVFKHKNKRETGRNTIFEEIKFYFTMTKEELLKQCRYYKGEEHSPYGDLNLNWFWEMERVFVANNGEFEGERDLYNVIGGRRFPGIPFPLLIVMVYLLG